MIPDNPKPSEQDDAPDFEAMVEALLKVDPEGITGQTAGRGKTAEDDEGPAD